MTEELKAQIALLEARIDTVEMILSEFEAALRWFRKADEYDEMANQIAEKMNR